jgi:hypothetical protein
VLDRLLEFRTVECLGVVGGRYYGLDMNIVMKMLPFFLVVFHNCE